MMKPADLRILVVEDESDSALVINTALEYGGAKSWHTTTGEGGLDMLSDVKPNLVLVDLALPGMDGWGFLKQMRENPDGRDVPAIVVSAYLTPMVAKRALEAGFVACIPKPVETTRLVDQLLSVL